MRSHVIASTLRRLAAAGLTGSVLAAGGCAPGEEQAAANHGGDPAPLPPPVRNVEDDPATAETLRGRAVTYWQARRDDDWPVLFGFLETPERTGDEAEFAAWSQENDPFRTHDFRVGAALVDDGLGWVEVDSSTGMRRFPDVPPRDVSRWQRWRFVEGDWYPVPPRELEQHPAPPPERDAAEETRLRARFAESWEARHARDWARLYERVDPRDRLEIPVDEFAGVYALIEFISHEVEWAEAVGDRGRVRSTMVQNVTDPSLTKLPPQTIVIIEDWVRVDGDWYLDLKVQP